MKRTIVVAALAALCGSPALAQEKSVGEKIEYTAKEARRDIEESAKKVGQEIEADVDRMSERARRAERVEPGQPQTIETTVLGFKGSDLIVALNGIAVPVRVERSTTIAGVKPPVGGVQRRLKQAVAPGDEVSLTLKTDGLQNTAVSVMKVDTE